MIEHKLTPNEKNLGGIIVRRFFPVIGHKNVGPFVFFDHFGPVEFVPGEGMDVRPHPHIGLSTVTYLFEGEILHRDSLGVVQVIRPGEINLMVSGKGIVHSERTAPDKRASGQVMHGLQLWLALPDQDEDCDPAFYHYDTVDIPGFSENRCQIKLLIGEAYGLRSPVITHCPTLYFECRLDAGASLALPEGIDELGVFVISGQVKVADDTIDQHQLAIIDSSQLKPLSASGKCHFVVIGGEPQGKRHIDWNFVSTSGEKIERAKQDWKMGTFPPVPGETGGIPLP
ncbi:MAG: pirin family protein [Gammaproteobacteria bacterium]|nr:pirin family protein [Gammaproteobacteria bacterium]